MAVTFSQVEYALNFESTAGVFVAPTSTSGFLPNSGADFDTKNEQKELKDSFGRVEDISFVKTSMKMGDGKLHYPLGFENLGTTLMMIFGQAPTTTGSSSPYTSTFQLLNTNNHQTFSVTRVDSERGTVGFPYCLLDKLSIKADKNGEFVHAECDVRGGGEATQTSVTSTYSTTETFITPDMITVKEAANVAGLVSATAFNPEKLQLSFSKNAEPKGGLGTVNVVRNHNKRFGATGMVEIELNGDSDRQNGLNSSTRAFQVIISNGTYSCTFQYEALVYETPKLSNSLDGIVTLSRNFKATRISTGMVKATLINNKSAYPLP